MEDYFSFIMLEIELTMSTRGKNPEEFIQPGRIWKSLCNYDEFPVCSVPFVISVQAMAYV